MEESLLNGKLLSHQGELEFSSVEAPIVLVYFSAHWCPPCRNFTPVLAKLYNEWNENGKQIEVIFVTSDRDEASFTEYFESMPWLAIPFGDERINFLKTECNVTGIPKLCLVNRQGRLVNGDGRNIVSTFGTNAVVEFQKLIK